MRYLLRFILISITIQCHTVSTPQSYKPVDIQAKKLYSLHSDFIDSDWEPKIKKWLQQGEEEISQFLKLEFKDSFDVHIFSDRKNLDAQWQKDWNIPNFKSECWMVASGVAHRLDILSPKVWDTQACEHENTNSFEMKRLIVHELTHVLHGQYNHSPTFDDIDNIDWFVEGLAVLVSGQLTDDRRKRALEYIKKTGGPKSLSTVWKGANRYGLAGLLVEFLYDKIGLDKLKGLMVYNNGPELLKNINMTEADILNQWIDQS
jgi:hypothetical protein